MEMLFVHREKKSSDVKNIGNHMENHIKSYEVLGSILVIFDIFLHILEYFDNGKSIFRPISSFGQSLGPIWSIFDHFIAIFI